MENKSIIIHHNDRDGRVSAALTIDYLTKIKNDISIELIETNYSKSVSELLQGRNLENCVVFIVDVSISDEENIDFLKSLNRVCWIDHHQTSFDTISKCNSFDISGLRMNGISAAALCYMNYNFSKFITHRRYDTVDLQKDKKYDYVCNIINKYSDTDKKVPDEDINRLFDIFEVPEYIRYVSRYDVFQSDDETIYQFNYGDLLTIVDDYVVKIKSGVLYSAAYTTDAINRGKIIKQYVDSKNESNIKNNSFKVSTSYHGDILEGIAVNDSSFSSLIFGDLIKDYDFAIIFQYNGVSYKYSIYSVKDTVRCDKIAESFGGGGHPKAAGFRSDKLIFDKNNRF